MIRKKSARDRGDIHSSLYSTGNGRDQIAKERNLSQWPDIPPEAPIAGGANPPDLVGI